MEYIDGSILQNSFVLGLCLLILASFVAGFIDAIAGGAGLVLVPSFILAGLPPQIALGRFYFWTKIWSVKSSPLLCLLVYFCRFCLKNRAHLNAKFRVLGEFLYSH